MDSFVTWYLSQRGDCYREAYSGTKSYHISTQHLLGTRN